MNYLQKATLLILASAITAPVGNAIPAKLPDGYTTSKQRSQYQNFEIIHTPPGNVDGMPDMKYFSGLFVNKDALLDVESIGIRKYEASYLINCRTTDIVQLSGTTFVTKEMKEQAPHILTNATELYQYEGFELKNYAKHNVLKQVILVMDSAVFKIACGYTPNFIMP